MGGYSVERSISVNAPAHLVHGLVNDFHHWPSWSPWEDLDPDLERSYTGPDEGVGARYAWRGNRKAGQGTMVITASAPEAIDLTIEFVKPFRSTSRTRLDIMPSGHGTHVRWLMRGEQQGLMGVVGRVISMDKMIGPDFERGLVRLKSVAEAAAGTPAG